MHRYTFETHLTLQLDAFTFMALRLRSFLILSSRRLNFLVLSKISPNSTSACSRTSVAKMDPVSSTSFSTHSYSSRTFFFGPFFEKKYYPWTIANLSRAPNAPLNTPECISCRTSLQLRKGNTKSVLLWRFIPWWENKETPESQKHQSEWIGLKSQIGFKSVTMHWDWAKLVVVTIRSQYTWWVDIIIINEISSERV